MFNGKIEPQRAAAIGRLLYSKYDYDKKGYIDKNQCFTIFSDNVYRAMVDDTLLRESKTHQPMKTAILCMPSLITTETTESQLRILNHWRSDIFAPSLEGHVHLPHQSRYPLI